MRLAWVGRRGRLHCAIVDGEPTRRRGTEVSCSRSCFHAASLSVVVAAQLVRIAPSGFRRPSTCSQLAAAFDAQSAANDVLPKASTFTGGACAGNWSMDLRQDHLRHQVSCLSSVISCSLPLLNHPLHTSSAFSRRCSFAARRRQSHTSARSQLLKHHYARQMHVGIGCVASFSENVQSF